MPLKFVQQDITKIKCDAIVNPTDRLFGILRMFHTVIAKK